LPPHLRPHRQLAPESVPPTARLCPIAPPDWPAPEQGAGDRPDRAPPPPSGGGCRPAPTGNRAPDRARRGAPRDAAALYRVLGGRPDAAGPHALHAPAD